VEGTGERTGEGEGERKKETAVEMPLGKALQ